MINHNYDRLQPNNFLTRAAAGGSGSAAGQARIQNFRSNKIKRLQKTMQNNKKYHKFFVKNKFFYILLLSVVFSLFYVSSVAAGQTITLKWDPNTENILEGYRVYQDGQKVEPDIICKANDSTCTTWKSPDLTIGLHKWHITAFAGEKESGPSQTVSYEVKMSSPGNLNLSINLSFN